MGLKFYFFICSLLLLFIIPFSANFPQTASLEATLTLKPVDGITIPFQNGFALPSFEKQGRQIIDLKGEWKKQRFAAGDSITLAKRDLAGYTNLTTEAAQYSLDKKGLVQISRSAGGYFFLDKKVAKKSRLQKKSCLRQSTPADRC